MCMPPSKLCFASRPAGRRTRAPRPRPLAAAVVAVTVLLAFAPAAAAAISFRGASMAARSASATTLVLPRPDAVLQGDVLVATVQGSGGSGVTITAPTGWTRGTSTAPNSASKVATYTKVAGASEPSGYTFSFSASAEHAGTVAAYAGADTANPVHVVAAQVNADAESIRCPSVTSSLAGAMLICTGGATNGFTFAYPAGMTERAEVRSGTTDTDRAVAVGDEPRPAVGATGTRTVADGSSLAGDNSVGVSILLAAAGAATVSDGTPPAAPGGLTAAPGAAQVAFDWADNGESDLAGYDVYRSTTSGGPYTRVNSAPIAASAYTDSGLTAGTPQHYVARALDRSGNASAASGEASATPTAAAFTPSGTLYFRGDAETASLSQWGSAEHCPTLNVISTQTGVVRKGAQAYRMLTKGQCSNMSVGRTRAELRSGSKYSWREGDTRFYGWSTYFEPGFPDITNSAHCNFIQWKDGDGGPPLSMGCRKSQIHFDYTPGGTCGWATPMARGGWHDFVVKVLHSTSESTGKVSLWHRAPGEAGLALKVFNCSESTHGTGTHALKQGLYRGDSSPSPAGVYQDEMRVGSTFDVVAP